MVSRPLRSRAAAGSSKAVKAPQIKTHGIPDGVIGGSSASHGGGGGTALTAAEHSAFDAYTSRLVAVLRQNHEKPPGLSDLLSADVECLIGADGTHLGRACHTVLRQRRVRPVLPRRLRADRLDAAHARRKERHVGDHVSHGRPRIGACRASLLTGC